MGRHSLPTNVHLLRGNPSKKSLADLVDELKPEIAIPNCPAHLLPEARKEWRRITPQLERYGLISKIDRAALSLYCQSWARWVWAERQMQRQMARAEEKRAEVEARGEIYSGGDGMTVATPNGHMTYSPHWVIANKAMEQVNKYLANFGMDPSSRGKVKPSDARQMPLPGTESADDQAGFDDL